MSDNNFYLDDCMYELAKAIHEVNLCQKCAVSRIKKIMTDLQPEDPEIITALSRAIDVGMDSPKRFSIFCKEAMTKIEKNIAIFEARKHAR